MSETRRAILQLQINILPSCIALVLLYILTYEARKPKHKISLDVLGKLQQLQNFVEWQNKLVCSKIVRQSIQVLPDICNSHISEDLAQVRMTVLCLFYHPTIFFHHLCFIVLYSHKVKFGMSFQICNFDSF